MNTPLFILGVMCNVPLWLQRRATQSLGDLYRDARARPSAWPSKALAVLGILLMLLSFAGTAAARIYDAPTVQPITAAMYDRYGRTPAEIEARFPIVIGQNLAKPGAAHRLAQLSPATLAALAQHYPGVVPIVATQVCVNVAARPDGEIRAVMLRDRQRIPPTTGVFNTIEEIYLDFVTDPAAALSPANALFETTIYAGGMGVAAWGVGYYQIGPQLYSLIDTYDPALSAAIGMDLDSVISFAGGTQAMAVQIFNSWLANAPPDITSGTPNNDDDNYGGGGVQAGGEPAPDSSDGTPQEDQVFRASVCAVQPHVHEGSR